MTATQLSQYIEAPQLMNQESLPFLKELTQRYPAFETGWMLYLKNLKNLDDASFEQELTSGAIRIQNRRKLYIFLNDTDNEPEPAVAPVQTKDDIYNLIFPTKYNLESTVKIENPIEETVLSIQNKPGKGDRLIDKFLEAQPRMPQIKDKESGAHRENNSTQEDVNEDFVTETLASIYAQQGYYKKAVQIFEKLSMKYPEKSTYFATQIEKIKHLMNN